MKLNKALKLSLGTLIAFPFSIFVGNELLANNLADKFCEGGDGIIPMDDMSEVNKTNICNSYCHFGYICR